RGLREAKTAYTDAVVAFNERRYKDAIDLLQQADRLTPSPAFSFNIALAYQEMGDSALALAHFRTYLRRAPDAEDRETADASIRRLERALEGKGIQQLTVLSSPPGAVVEIDGQRLGVTPWTGELAPGFHKARLQLPGYEEEARNFDL